MHDLLQMRPESRAAFEGLRARHEARLTERFEPRDADVFWLRCERWFEDARRPLLALYGDRSDAIAQADAIFDCVVERALIIGPANGDGPHSGPHPKPPP